MARIEISLEEYNQMKDTIEQQENTIAQLDKTINQFQEKNKKITDILSDIIEGTAFFDRLFNWKKIVNNIKNNIKNE